MASTKCENCHNWNPTKTTTPKKTKDNPEPAPVASEGECHKFAPGPQTSPAKRAAWPLTRADDFCGEGNPR